MTSTAEEKAFLSVAVAAIPRVAEIILGFPPDDRAGALETLSGASWLRHWTMAAPR
jgi:hypothetical protein